MFSIIFHHFLSNSPPFHPMGSPWDPQDPTVSFQAGSGTMEHLHGRLAQLRDDVAQVSLQRDQAQMQVKLLQAELDAWIWGRPWGWWGKGMKRGKCWRFFVLKPGWFRETLFFKCHRP